MACPARWLPTIVCAVILNEVKYLRSKPHLDCQIVKAAMPAIAVDAVFASALNHIGGLSSADLRAELQNQNESAWETSIQPPSQIGDPIGGLLYRPVHRDSLTSDEIFSQSLRQSFAGEFAARSSTLVPAHFAFFAMESAPTANAGILAGSATTRSIGSTCSDYRASLALILRHMERTANLCAESVVLRDSSAVIEGAATTLVATMQKLRALASAPDWQLLNPVIYNLDWQLRMLPPQSPEKTFRAHAQAYAWAARVLQRAVRNAASRAALNNSIEVRNTDWSGNR